MFFGGGSMMDESLPPDVNRRPSYMEIAEIPLPNHFDERVIRSLESRFEEEEDPPEPEPIRTYLRIRPYMKKSEDEVQVLEVKDDKTVIASHHAPGPGMKGRKVLRKMEFSFSRVLDETCSQETVFEETIAPLLDRFEGGEDCLVFSYGATNSGKTYTMRGSAKKYGIIPRTLDRIFGRFQDRIYKGGDIQPFRHESTRQLTQELQKILCDKKRLLINAANETSEMKQRLLHSRPESRNSDVSSHCASVRYAAGGPGPSDTRSLDGTINLYGLWVSFIELYNERCYDLLAGGSKRTEVRIVSEKGGYAYFKDVTELPVFNDEEAYALYVAGYKKLEVAATQANLTSSRSHCFFTIRVVELGVTVSNTVYPIKVHRMTFCDLAGCERVNQTENTGGLLKESANINNSLLSLLKVIRMIRDKQGAGGAGYGNQSFLEKIPFRDSKLTRIFQGYFTTSTHIAMIVNVNPIPKMVDSSMQTLMNSAIASNVVAFRPKPPPILMVEQHNSSFLHSSLDLEDLTEEEEEDLEEFSRSGQSLQSSSVGTENTENTQNTENTSTAELEMSKSQSQLEITPSRVLKENNFASASETVKAQKTKRNHHNNEDKENKENSVDSSSPGYFSGEGSTLEIYELKCLIAQLNDELIQKNQEIQRLNAKVRSVEAETREKMMTQLMKINPACLSIQQRPLPGLSSDQRPNNRSRIPHSSATIATQTGEF